MEFDKEIIGSLLKTLTGYELTNADDALVDLSIQATVDFVLSYCNRNNLPKRLRTQLYRMIVGEFLYQKKTLFGYESLGLDPSVIVTSIKDGDTQTNYGSNDQSQVSQLDDFIDDLRHGSLVTLQEYRRLKW